MKFEVFSWLFPSDLSGSSGYCQIVWVVQVHFVFQRVPFSWGLGLGLGLGSQLGNQMNSAETQVKSLMLSMWYTMMRFMIFMNSITFIKYIFGIWIYIS